MIENTKNFKPGFKREVYYDILWKIYLPYFQKQNSVPEKSI